MNIENMLQVLAPSVGVNMIPFNEMFTSKEVKKGTRRSFVFYIWCLNGILGLCLALYIAWGIGNIQGLHKYYSEGITYGVELCKSTPGCGAAW